MKVTNTTTLDPEADLWLRQQLAAHAPAMFRPAVLAGTLDGSELKLPKVLGVEVDVVFHVVPPG